MGLLESLDGQPPAGVGWEFDGYSLGFLKLDMVGKRYMFFFESDMYRTFGYIERCTVNANTCW